MANVLPHQITPECVDVVLLAAQINESDPDYRKLASAT
jgi:hypothetical protein